jgi:O-antigen/teichoic acid export membrane protein
LNLRTKAIHGFSWSLADKLFNQLGYLAVTVYLARVIGPESFGLIGMLTIFVLLTESVVNNGFSQALVQRSHQLTVEDENTIFYVNLSWGILIYCLLYALAPLIADFYNESKLVEISRLLFLVILINSLAVVVRAKLIIDIDFKSQAIANSIGTLSSGAIGLYLASIGYGYWSLVWMLLSRAIFNTLGLWFFCRWRPRLIFSSYSFKNLFKFGSNLMAAGLVATFVNNLYIALIGRFFNAVQVGYFTQASNLSNSLNKLISSTLMGITYPILTSIKEQDERLISIYKQIISITTLASLPVILGFAAISEEFVLIFLGDDWRSAIPILTALCFARAITPLTGVNLSILNAIGRSDLFLKVDLLKLPLTLGALFIALPYGIEAVAWAMVCTSVISFFINAYYPGKFFGCGAFLQIKMAAKYIIAVVIMFTCIMQVSIDSSLWLQLVVKVILGALIYPLVLFLLRDSFFTENSRLIWKKLKSS